MIRCRQVVGGDVVNRLLAVLHARLVLGQRHTWLVALGNALGAHKAQQLGDFFLVGEVLTQTFFEHRSKGLVKLGVLTSQCFVLFARIILGVVFVGQVLEHGEHATGVALANGFHIAAFLEQLAAHVERQIGRVHHAFDKAQVNGHQGFCILHDEDALDIKLHTGSLVAVVQIKRGLAWDVQELCVLGAALDSVVTPRQRILKVVRDGLVKGLVVLFAQIFLGSSPQCTGFVDGLPLVGCDHLTGLIVLSVLPLFFEHQNGQRDVIRIFTNDALELPLTQVLERIFSHVQNDVRATLGLLDGFHLELARARTGPTHAL